MAIANVAGVSDKARERLMEIVDSDQRLTFAQVAFLLTYSYMEDQGFDLNKVSRHELLEDAPEAIFVFCQSPDTLYGKRYGARWNLLKNTPPWS